MQGSGILEAFSSGFSLFFHQAGELPLCGYHPSRQSSSTIEQDSKGGVIFLPFAVL